MPRFPVLALAALCAAASAAAGPSKPGETPAALQSVLDCRKIAESAQRLACFDAAVEAMEKAQTSGDLVAVDKTQRQQVRRQAFGFSLPSLDIFDRGEKPSEVNHLDVVIKGAHLESMGKWVFEFEDGAVWRQIDSNELYRAPKPGTKAEIRRAALGSFMLSIPGESFIRVKRDR
jgi:hypothetical protein